MPNPSCVWGYEWPRDFDIGDLPNRGEVKPSKPTVELLVPSSETDVIAQTVTVGKFHLYNSHTSQVMVTIKNKASSQFTFFNNLPVPANGTFAFEGPLYLEGGMTISASVADKVVLQMFKQP